MTSEVKNIIKNFEYRLAAISPNGSLAGVKSKFFYIGEDEDPRESPGYTRSFDVDWNGIGGFAGIENQSSTVADHMFSVEVYYHPAQFGKRKTQFLIASDQRDIVKCMHDASKWVGYDSNNPSADIGLKHRFVRSASLTEVDGIYVLRLDTVCTVFEGWI